MFFLRVECYSFGKKLKFWKDFFLIETTTELVGPILKIVFHRTSTIYHRQVNLELFIWKISEDTLGSAFSRFSKSRRLEHCVSCFSSLNEKLCWFSGSLMMTCLASGQCFILNYRKISFIIARGGHYPPNTLLMSTFFLRHLY